MLHNAPLITYSQSEVNRLSLQTLRDYAWSWVQSLGLNSASALTWLCEVNRIYIEAFIATASLQPETPDRNALNGWFKRA